MRPKPGEVWETNKGQKRFVKSVSPDGEVIYGTGDGKTGFASREGWLMAEHTRGLRKTSNDKENE